MSWLVNVVTFARKLTAILFLIMQVGYYTLLYYIPHRLSWVYNNLWTSILLWSGELMFMRSHLKVYYAADLNVLYIGKW